jgi:hypothetical protein
MTFPLNSTTRKQMKKVNWYDYIACFFAGIFLTNVVPHFVHGISGDRFPAPFAHPPGKGLSAPTAKVVWALFNLVVGYVLFRVGKVSRANNSALVIFFAGVVATRTTLSVRFANGATPRSGDCGQRIPVCLPLEASSGLVRLHLRSLLSG